MFRTPLATYENATGFILDWFVTGFFPNGVIGGEAPDLFEPKRSRHWQRDCLAAYGGCPAIRDLPRPRGLAKLEFLPLQAPPHFPKLHLHNYRRLYPELERAFPPRWDHCWYALAVIHSDRRRDAELRFCGHDGCQLWWNGQFLFQEHSWHKLPFDLEQLPVTLNKGRNTVLMKLDRFGLVARLTAPGGAELAGSVCSLTTARPRQERMGTFAQLGDYARTLKVTMPCAARTAAEYRRWAKAARAHYHACLGPFPRIVSPSHRGRPNAPQARLVEKAKGEGYTRQTHHLAREAGSVIPVHVLIPAKGRFNGRTVICPHGHGQDDKHVAGLAGPEKPHGNWFGRWTGNYAQQMAQAGFLTATWGERALSHQRDDLVREGAADPCDAAALGAMAMGFTLPGLHLWDLHGVTDFVQGLPGVQKRRLGLMGLSGGAMMTYLAGAYDDRFQAVAPFCGLHSYVSYATGRDGCGQQIVPGLFPTLDTPELLCLTAPRPLLIAQGRKDVIFDVFLAQRLADQARRAYALLGAQDKVETAFYDLAHQVDIEVAIDFFTRCL